MAVNTRRDVYPLDSVLPPPASGNFHYLRAISGFNLMGQESTNVYLSTGEFGPADTKCDLAAVRRAPAIIFDADISDWLFHQLGGIAGVVSLLGDLDEAVIYNAAGSVRTKPGNDNEREQRAKEMLKVHLYRQPRENIHALLDQHRRLLEKHFLQVIGQMPTVLTCSGWGHHAFYWLLADQGFAEDKSPAGLLAAREVNKHLLEEINRRAGFELVDRQTHDAGTRILREIGSVNTKSSANPIPVTRVGGDPASRLDLHRFHKPAAGASPGAEGAAPPPSASSAAPSPAPPPPPAGGAASPSSPPSSDGKVLPKGYTGDIKTLDVVALFQGAGLYIGPGSDEHMHRVQCPWAHEHGSKAEARVWTTPGAWRTFRCHNAVHTNVKHIGHVIEALGIERANALSTPFTPTRKSTMFVRGDEVEVAQTLIKDHLAPYAVHDRNQFHVYDPASGIWTVVPPSHIFNLALSYAGRDVIIGVQEDGKPKTRALKLSAKGCEGVRTCVMNLLAQPKFFDDRVRGCGFTNGVLLDTGYFYPSSPNYRLLAEDALPFSWEPGDVDCPNFLGYLCSQFDPDPDGEQKKMLVLEFIGMALLGCAPRFERALLLSGKPGSGKSTLITVIRALFPPASRAAVPPQKMGHPFEAHDLHCARINLASDLPDRDLVDSGDLKAIVSGDEITWQQKNKPAFRARPRAAHVFAANTLISVADRTDGFWDRFAVLEFNRRFRRSANQDTGLADRIVNNELKQVATLAINVALALLRDIESKTRRDLTIPPSSVRAVATWRLHNNPAAQWAAERLRPAATHEESLHGRDLYPEYRRWCLEEAGVFHPLGRNKFLLEMDRLFEKSVLHGDRRFLCRWRQAGDPEYDEESGADILSPRPPEGAPPSAPPPAPPPPVPPPPPPPRVPDPGAPPRGGDFTLDLDDFELGEK